MKNFRIRLQEFLVNKDLSQLEFEKITGYKAKTLNNIVTGITKNPSVQLIQVLIKHFPDLNLRWLLMGEGDMFYNEKEIRRIKQSTVDNVINELLYQIGELKKQ